MEEIDGAQEITEIEQVEEFFKNDSNNNYSVRVEIVRDMVYKNR